MSVLIVVLGCSALSFVGGFLLATHISQVRADVLKMISSVETRAANAIRRWLDRLTGKTTSP